MQKFDTPAPVTAILDIPAGRVRFIAADRADTTVEIRPADASHGRDVKMAEQTTAAYGDGVLRIQGPAKNQALGNPGSIEVTVQLPVGSRVEARAASAEFRTVGRLGDVTFDGPHATVKVDEAATARLSTLAGDITVGRLGGDAEIRTAKGDIKVAEAVRGTVVLGTQAGLDLGRRRRRSLGRPGRRHRPRPDPQLAQEHRRHPRPDHPRDHRRRRHHRPQPLRSTTPSTRPDHEPAGRAVRPSGLTALSWW